MCLGRSLCAREESRDGAVGGLTGLERGERGLGQGFAGRGDGALARRGWILGAAGSEIR